ncbi:MAG: MOSC domain-containing protein [Myxococcales bacterium]|nr:MOSC domain-containing protein [Myxococcales bacterium]MDH3844108.1 MOSC domain-containing protein [Myxococcales bacterium]
MAELVSVNVGLPRPVDTPRGPVMTAIFKSPTDRRLRVESHNLEGDRQADPSVHGGENKAIYGYPVEHYPVWADELGRHDLQYGQFGENLTTRGLFEHDVGIGDVFSIGSSVLAVSQPRAPCFKLGIRMGDPRFVKTFLQSGRPGFYFRIVESGELGVGDEVTRIDRGLTGMTVREIWELSYGGGSDRERTKLALEIPTLGDEWRKPMLAKLAG